MRYIIKINSRILVFFLIIVGIVSCDLINDISKDDKSSSSSTVNASIVGEWTRQICNGTKTATLAFYSNGTGYFEDEDCTGQCTRHFSYTYTDNGGSVTLNYTYALICGERVNPPTGGTQSYTLSGNSLFLGQWYSRAN